MNLLDLSEALVVVADTGSILQAAKALFQTSAAISKKISKLEEHLKVELFIRGRKGVQLTPAGQVFYHQAKKAIEQFKIAENSLSEITKIPQGELKVVANHYYCSNIIIPKLNAFQKKYPKIKLSIEGSEVLPEFNTKKMDILFGVSTNGEDQLVRRVLTKTRYALCASAKYLKEKGLPSSPAELLQHSYIGHSNRIPVNQIYLEEDNPILLNPCFLFDHTNLMIQAALHGLGLIWTHENIVQDLLKKKQLIEVLTDHNKRPITIYAYYPYKKFHDPKIKAFLDFFSI